MPTKILVVDDQPLLGELAARILSGAGYDVQVAGGAVEAEELFRQQRPDVLLTDLYMPDRDGLELTRRCKEKSPMLLTVLMGGAATSEVMVDFGLVDATLQKPFTTGELLDVVHREAARIRGGRRLGE